MAYSQSPPLMPKEWPTGEEITSGGHARDPHARSNQRIGVQPKKSSIHSPHSSSIKDDWAASHRRPSIGRRIFRTLTRFFIAVLIGVGATLAWQSYGDTAREMMVARIPTLAWLLSVSATKPPPVVAATPPASAQQLESLASNLDGVRRSVEQLAAKQEQIAQNIATLQTVEEDIRQKMLYTPPSSSQAAPIPQQKSPQPRAQSSSVPRPSPPAGSLSLPR